MKTEILYGIHPVREALGAGRRTIREILVNTGGLKKRAADGPGSGRKNGRGKSAARASGKEKPEPAGGGRRLEELIRFAENRGIAITHVPADHLSFLCRNERHQQVAARVSPLPVAMDLPPLSGTGFWVVLDGITDPQNLGALARTALCAGADGVIQARDRSSAPTPAASRASAGALEHLPLIRVVNLVRSLQELQDAGIWVTGLDTGGGTDIYDMDFSGPAALVIGAEGKGIRPLVRRHCDFLAAIPQAGPLDSLNASAAGAVAMYEVFRQRRAERAARGEDMIRMNTR